MYKVLAHEMAINWPLSKGRRKVLLVEVMDHTMHRVEDRSIRVILAAAMLVCQVKLRSILEWLATEIISWSTRTIDTTGRKDPCQALLNKRNQDAEEHYRMKTEPSCQISILGKKKGKGGCLCVREKES